MVEHLDPALSCDPFGSRIVDRLSLRPGMRVLDVRHRTGAVRIPPVGAVDWHLADLSALPADSAGFDVVICGFGIDQANDMTVTTRRLWQLVRPAGQLLLVTCSEAVAVDTPELLVETLAAAGIPGGAVWVTADALFAIARK